MRVESLATEQSIPHNYLVQILIELKNAGIVRSQRGKDGGYWLARSPDDITIADVLQHIHGRVFEPPSADSQCPAELRESWSQIQRALDEAAGAISFQQMVEAGRQEQEMYYI